MIAIRYSVRYFLTSDSLNKNTLNIRFNQTSIAQKNNETTVHILRFSNWAVYRQTVPDPHSEVPPTVFIAFITLMAPYIM